MANVSCIRANSTHPPVSQRQLRCHSALNAALSIVFSRLLERTRQRLSDKSDTPEKLPPGRTDGGRSDNRADGDRREHDRPCQSSERRTGSQWHNRILTWPILYCLSSCSIVWTAA